MVRVGGLVVVAFGVVGSRVIRLRSRERRLEIYGFVGEEGSKGERRASETWSRLDGRVNTRWARAI